MKNPIKRYQFWFKAIGAAILLTLGIVIIFQRSIGSMLVLGFSGSIVLIMGLIRFIPLMRTLENKKSKIISAVEMVLDIIIGGILFYGAVEATRGSDITAVGKFIDQYYRYFIGVVLYLRGVVYFMVSILYKENTDKIKFWSHIAFLTLGVLFMSLKDTFTAEKLSIFIAILSLICSGALIIDGGISFGRYRKYVKESTQKGKVKEVVDEATLNMPARDEQNKGINDSDEKDEIKDPKKDDKRPYIS